MCNEILELTEEQVNELKERLSNNAPMTDEERQASEDQDYLER